MGGRVIKLANDPVISCHPAAVESVGRYYDPATGQFLSVDPLVDETGQPYAYTGDDPVNGVDPSGLCTDSNGVYLVPGPCEFSNPSWVQSAIGQIQAQYAAPGYWDQVAHNFEDFGEAFVGDPETYCSPVAGTLSGLSDALFDVVGAADGVEGSNPANGATDEGAAASDDEAMLGAGGTQVTSRTLLQTSSYHIDVENPAPGVRPGQIHLQDYAGSKYIYDVQTGAFEGLPSNLAKQVAQNPAVARAIATGLRYLGIGN